jgi:hypothetical protein
MVDSNNFGHGMALTVSGRANVHAHRRAPGEPCKAWEFRARPRAACC